MLIELGANPRVYNKEFLLPVDVAGKLHQTVSKDHRVQVQNVLFHEVTSMQTLILHHEDCLLHDTKEGHQESPLRIPAILNALEESRSKDEAPSLKMSTDFAPATLHSINRAHYSKYIDLLEELDQQVKLQENSLFAMRCDSMRHPMDISLRTITLVIRCVCFSLYISFKTGVV